MSALLLYWWQIHDIDAACIVCGKRLGNGWVSVRPSVCLSSVRLSNRSTAATAAGGVRRYRSIDSREHAAGAGAQQQARAALRCEPTEEAEHRTCLECTWVTNVRKRGTTFGHTTKEAALDQILGNHWSIQSLTFTYKTQLVRNVSFCTFQQVRISHIFPA